MTDRDTTLQWLVSQAKDYPSGGLLPYYDSENARTRAMEALRTGKVAISEELVWDLAISAVTRWKQPIIPEIEQLGNVEKFSLLRFAEELALNSGLDEYIWLALAAHCNCASRINVGLGQHDLPWLTEKLRSSSTASRASTEIDEILAHIDSLIESVSESRSDIAAAVSVAAVSMWSLYWTSYSDTQRRPGNQFAEQDAITKWVNRHADGIIQRKAVSNALLVEIYEFVCTTALSKTARELRGGVLPVSSVSSRFRELISTVNTSHLKEPLSAAKTLELADRWNYFAEMDCGEWLVENGNPSAALTHLSWAADCFSNVSLSEHAKEALDVILALALDSLGYSNLAIKQLDPYSANSPSPDLWALGRLWCDTGDERGIIHLRKIVDLPEEVGYWQKRARMSLLVAEKEIEAGNPRKALQLLDRWMHADIAWIFCSLSRNRS